MENNNQSRGKGKNNSVASRRAWQKKEEDVLIASIMQLIDQGWRNENGQFKTGFYVQLEEKLKVAFHETDLRASPHIESKVKLFKRHYYAVFGMLRTSEFGWNDIEKTILVNSHQVWKNYLKKDVNAKGLRYKSFPYYNEWCAFFGKDRATGDLAEGPTETVAAMNKEEVQTNNNTTPLPNDVDCSINGTPSTHVEGGTSNGKRKSRCESISIGLTSIAEQFGCFFNQTNDRIGEIAQRIGYSQDLSESRKMVYSMLMSLPLESKFRIKAASMIVREADKVDLFFSLPEQDRAEWVYLLLDGEI